MSDATVAQHTLQHRLRDIPDSTFSHVRMGFKLIPKLSDRQLEEIVSYVIGNMSRKTRYDPDMAASISGIDKSIVGDLLSAIAISVGSIFDIDASEDDFFEFAPDDFKTEDVRPHLSKIVSLAISRREQIKADIERSKIANAILPSFKFIEYDIDIRIQFDDENNILDKIPTAICYIATDLDEDVTFQASIADIDDIIEKLNKAKEQLLKAAE